MWRVLRINFEVSCVCVRRLTMSNPIPFRHKWTISHFSRLLSSDLSEFPPIRTCIEYGDSQMVISAELYKDVRSSGQSLSLSIRELKLRLMSCTVSIFNATGEWISTKGE